MQELDKAFKPYLDEASMDIGNIVSVYAGLESAYIGDNQWLDIIDTFRRMFRPVKHMKRLINNIDDISTLRLLKEPTKVNFTYDSLVAALNDITLGSLAHNIEDKEVRDKFTILINRYTTMATRYGLKGLAIGVDVIKTTKSDESTLSMLGTVMTILMSKLKHRNVPVEIKRITLEFLSVYYCAIYNKMFHGSLKLDDTGILSKTQIEAIRKGLVSHYGKTMNTIDLAKNHVMNYDEKVKIITELQQKDAIEALREILDYDPANSLSIAKDLLKYASVEEVKTLEGKNLELYETNGTIPNLFKLVNLTLDNNYNVIIHLYLILKELKNI